MHPDAALRRPASPPMLHYRSPFWLFAWHGGTKPNRPTAVDAVPPGLRRDVALEPEHARPRLTLRPWL